MKVAKYLPEIVVFVSGATIMVYELVGTRVLGPYFGTSIHVWTNIIGIFLGSLSIGYYLGGKLADRTAPRPVLANLLLAAGILIACTLATKEPFLRFVQGSVDNVSLGSAIAALTLFLPSSLLLGMVSPLAGKLKITSLASSGTSLGMLYAISTIGSIAGTYAAGFWLIPTLGTNKILLCLALVLVALSLVVSRSVWQLKIVVLYILCASGQFMSQIEQKRMDAGFIDVDTPYNRVWIYEGARKVDERRVRVMGINGENHSSMFVDSDDLANEYTKYFDLARAYSPNFKTALMLGGAGYSYPKMFLQQYPNAELDVVEIDARVTDLAKEHFRLRDDPRMTIHHLDARVYLNQTNKKYDVIYGDVFSSRYAPPFHLTTIEAVKKMYDATTHDGVVIVNLITGLKGDAGVFFRAQYNTFANIFPHLAVYMVDSKDEAQVQNIIIVATKQEHVAPELYKDNLWIGTIEQDMPQLTDDFAPVEHYISKNI